MTSIRHGRSSQHRKAAYSWGADADTWPRRRLQCPIWPYRAKRPHSPFCIYAVVDGNIPHAILRKDEIRILSRHHIVSAQSRQILCDYHIDLSALDIADHPLEVRPVKRRPRISVVYVGLLKRPPPFLYESCQHLLLVDNAHAFRVSVVIISGQPAIDTDVILRADVGLNEMYILNSLGDYLQFELIKFILSSLPLLQCQNCWRIFIPRGRQDVKYCDKVAEGETLPCDAIGALRVYKNKVADDPIFKAFNKAYKRMNSRIKYKNLSQQEFYEWSEKARTMRAKCISGEISLEEFNKRLGNRPYCKE